MNATHTLVRTLIPLLATVAVAAAAAIGSPHQARELLVEVADTIVAELDRDEVRRDERRVRELVERELLPHVDFERAARLVLGRHWRSATAEQRRRFTHEFRGFVVRFYTTALAEYLQKNELPDGLVSFGDVRAREGSRIVEVPSVFHLTDGRQVEVNYRLYWDAERWKVIDVTVAGISMVTNYRTTFSQEIGQYGLDGLIERLAQRNLELEKP